MPVNTSLEEREVGSRFLAAVEGTGLDLVSLEDGPHGLYHAVLTDGHRRWRFLIENRGRAPYPNELNAWPPLQRTQRLLLCDYVSQPLADRLVDIGWSFADDSGNIHLQDAGLLIERRRRRTPSKGRISLPQGRAGLLLIRTVVAERNLQRFAPSELAAQLELPRPRVAQTLAKLRDIGLAETVTRGEWRVDRAGLLDAFIESYRGPGGRTVHAYSLDEPRDIAELVARSVDAPVVISGDVGADLIAPWRRPTTAVIYSHTTWKDKQGLVMASAPEDANVLLCSPTDQSIFATADRRHKRFHVADPLQVMWDLQRLGGSDRLEHMGQIREWLLR